MLLHYFAVGRQRACECCPEVLHLHLRRFRLPLYWNFVLRLCAPTPNRNGTDVCVRGTFNNNNVALNRSVAFPRVCCCLRSEVTNLATAYLVATGLCRGTDCWINRALSVARKAWFLWTSTFRRCAPTVVTRVGSPLRNDACSHWNFVWRGTRVRHSGSKALSGVLISRSNGVHHAWNYDGLNNCHLWCSADDVQPRDHHHWFLPRN